MVLKRLILLTLLSSSLASLGQTKSTLINSIKKEFQKINTDASYKIITLSAEDFLDHQPDGGAELTGYFKGNQIRKIHQRIGLSNGIETFDFYYQNSQLIFVYERFDAFIYVDSLKSLDLSKTYLSFEGRYYFNNQKLIDEVTLGHNRFEADGIQPESTLLKESNEKVTLLKRKKK